MIPGWLSTFVTPEILGITQPPITATVAAGDSAFISEGFEGAREVVAVRDGDGVLEFDSGISANGDFGFYITMMKTVVHGIIIIDSIMFETAIRLTQEACPRVTDYIDESCPTVTVLQEET